MQWDVFISHATEEKDEVARPLAKALHNAGLRVWLDENELQLGDSLRAKIDHGLANARFGIVILSPDFFAKDWPQRELNGLLTRETRDQKIILPLWHKIDQATLAQYSPILADRYAINTDRGIAHAVTEILRVCKPTTELPPVTIPRPERRTRRQPRATRQGEATRVPVPITPIPVAPPDGLTVRTRVRITPIFPIQCANDECHIDLEDAQYVRVSKNSGHQVRIPRSLIRRVLPGETYEPTTIVLDGRLQWLSASRSWKVFPEAPSTPTERQFGFPKPSSLQDPRVQEVMAALARYNRTVRFTREDRIGERFSEGWQLVYDEDGLYFRWQGHDTAQLLIAKGP